MAKRYCNILFDLDGTLTDSAPGVARSVQYALKKFKISAELGDLIPFIGPPLQHSFQNHYGFSEEEAKKAVAFYREYYREKGIYENKVYTGIAELLAELKNREVSLYLATSKPTFFAGQVLANFDLTKFFKGITGSNLDGTRVDKTEVITHVITENKLATEKTLMVGDREHDIIGARNCNIDSAAVAYGYGTEEELTAARPTYLVKSVREFKNLLLNLTC
ncbi:MAG: HAD family hydrolase [Bacillota bacterium]|nr:HAD family hydrolase [Bacillota bacterium]